MDQRKENWRVTCGDSLDVLKLYPDACFDSMVSDPPAGISFMNKAWDGDKGGRDQWIAWLAAIMAEAFRTLKPGAHCLVWALPRTSSWTCRALEDAGFEVRDILTHNFGSGFPKNHDISLNIDKAAGAEREVLGVKVGDQPAATEIYGGFSGEGRRDTNITAPATDAAKQWEGWGTAMKPSNEIWVRAVKPIAPKKLADAMGAATNALELFLWSISPVKFAEMCSGLSPGESGADRSDSVRWIAGACLGAESPERSALMDMFSSQEAAETFLSIAQSWRAIWEDVYRNGNTYTTETATALTTALKILRSSTLQITPENTPVEKMLQGGGWASALNAEKDSNAGLWSWINTLNASARGPAGQPNSSAILCIIASIVETISTHHQSISGSSAGCAATDLVDEKSEHWVLCRKPLDGTIVGNVLEHGTGGINIGASRVPGELGGDPNRFAKTDGGSFAEYTEAPIVRSDGRWPANTLLSHSASCAATGAEDCPVAEMDRQSGGLHARGNVAPETNGIGFNGGASQLERPANPSDSGGASRFFNTFRPDPFPFKYCAKPSSAERDAGLDSFATLSGGEATGRVDDSAGTKNPRAGAGRLGGRKNSHPTTKGHELMRWLCKLITPPGGQVLDPFAGSGTTGIACALEGFGFHGIELDSYHVDIARARIAYIAGGTWEPMTEKATAEKPSQGSLF